MTKSVKTITRKYHQSKTGINNLRVNLTSPKVVDPAKPMESGRSLVWSRTSSLQSLALGVEACHADDPGSNLGDRTKI